MRALWALLLLFVPWMHGAEPGTAKAGDELFTNGVVRRISITISDAGIAQLRKNPRASTPAIVRESMNTHTNVLVHLKGSSGSFRKIDNKPGLTLNFSAPGGGPAFHGLSKIHLNNSVEDATYLHELIGSEAFARAGIPAARVTHALVELNGRSLGLYVLKEGFTPEFLRRYFQHPGGNLYEPGGQARDVDDELELQLGKAESRRDLAALTAAAEEPDPARRWERLQQTLDLDRFITFMAMEILIGHRDGYCLARNNFRVYHDLDSGRMMFFPHGMDQLFGYARLPMQPRMNGLVARAIMDLPEGRQRYRDRAARLLADVLVLPALTGRVDQVVASLQSALPQSERAALVREADSLKQRIAERLSSADQQLRQAPLELLAFHDDVAALRQWQPTDIPEEGSIAQASTPEGKTVLRIQAGPKTFASWRSKVILAPGKYRLEGSLRTVDVAPLPFGKNHGATLRVTNAKSSPARRWIGTTSWEPATVEFEVTELNQETDLVCELRASKGEALFDLESLRLVRLP